MSEVSDALGAVAGAAASGPLGGISAIMQAVNDIIGKFVTDPNQKLQASQHALDLQAQLQMAQLDAITKQTQSANDSASKTDKSLPGARAFFCYGFTALYLLNYSGIMGKILHTQVIDVPENLNFIFAGIMLGFVGIPAALEAMKSILAMPGESTVSGPLFKAGNKS
jgi:hypothetical protein